MASSSSSVPNKRYKYDVFLSFCGVDTRKTFVDHLYAALDQHAIRTFKDDERLQKGKKISDELLQSIEDSRLYVIVFSKNYASSSWCLNELLKIMECHKTDEQTAFPVFYDVEPSEVRKQSGSVGEALAKQTDKNESEIEKWREALKEAANLSGWDVRMTADGHEAKVIKLIVERVSLELRPIHIDVDENLVGMEQRMQDLDPCLEIGANDVRMIGIKGMGGAGKTTLAWAIFNKIFMDFEGQSFVENVRDKTSKIGLEKLQEQVLGDVLKDKNITISGVHEGENLMKNKLCGKKVLVVLDDVDDISQLKMLAGDITWFKPGSRIIITTRDEKVLGEHKVTWIRDVSLLLEEEAICLFSRHAFGKEVPTQGHEMHSREVVRYAAGLPLTIKVLGSKLCGKDNSEWTYTLERLKTIPLQETLTKLELSYESLEDEHKDMFLDFACFLRGWEKEDTIRMLESCGFHAKYGLRVLEQKSLIAIVKKDYGATIIGMHDHLVEMGKNIVRREHPDEPNKHSRLWIQEEIEHVLAGRSGSEAVRCIDLKITPGIYVRGLANLKKIRCLIVKNSTYNFSHGYPWYFFGRSWKHDKPRRYFPNSLQYIHWIGYPYRCLPKTFEANNLVTLVMHRSKMKQLWEGKKVIESLKYVDLSGSEKLRSLDFGMTPNLESLNLSYCSKFKSLLPSIGNLHKLVSLNLEGCYDLKSLPPSIGNLHKLVSLNLEGCYDLKSLPPSIGNLHKLVSLNLEGCYDLKSLPSSIGNLHKLVSLNLEGCYDLKSLPSSIGNLHKLVSLNLSYCWNLKSLPSSIGNLHKLVSLNLCRCFNLKNIPSSIGNLHKFVSLNLEGCYDLKSLPSSIGNLHKLVSLNLSYCWNLKSLPSSIGNLHKLVSLDLEGCYDLKSLPSSIGNLHKLVSLNLCRCFNLKSIPSSIGNLHKFVSLNLEGCYDLKSLPSLIGNLHKLVSLNLSYCWNLKSLPSSIGNLHKLVSLDLEGCYDLKSLPSSIGNLHKLVSLNLSYCWNLKSLPSSIGNLHKLVSLNLSYCLNLKSLPSSIGNLHKLVSLNLSYCWNLKSLPSSIGNLHKLVSLNLSYCLNLKSLPSSIRNLHNLVSLNLEDCINLKSIPGSICKLNI